MQHAIFHLEVRDFLTAAVEKGYPRLRKRPFVIVSQQDSSQVLAASPAARAMGICKGMRLHDARKIDRHLAMHPADVEYYQALNLELLETAAAYSPITECASQGAVYLDMINSRLKRDRLRDTAYRLRREVMARLALPAALGLGANKLVSRAASIKAAQHDDIIDVPVGNEKDFLSPFWLRILPHADRRTVTSLRDLNIRTVGELQTVPEPELRDLFGRNGLWLYREAQGIDLSPVLPVRQQIRLQQSWRLTPPSNDFHLARAGSMLLSRLARQLRRRGVSAKRMTLSATYQDGRFFSGMETLAGAIASEEQMMPAAHRLLERLAQRRVAVARITISLSHLFVVRQIELFEEATSQHERGLTAALDRIQDRFGEQAILWGRQMHCQ